MSFTERMALVGEILTKRSPSVVVPTAERLFCWFSTEKTALGGRPREAMRLAENST